MSEFLRLVLGPDLGAAAIAALIDANVAASVAILLVAAARVPVRRAYGPETACSLWLLPPLTAAAYVLLRRADLADAPAPFSSETLILAGWAAGALAVAASLLYAQARFIGEVRARRAGPAVVGLISPRIVLPADDGTYSTEERELIRAHEREHVARKDPRAAALAALFQCLCWFNPLVHLAARLLRLDQELACDAAVVRARPTARRLYANTLLKTQLAATPLPFGCYFGAHPLEVRVEMLKRKPGKRGAGPAGAAIVQASGEAIRP
jgi:beta-lactamase regulating signal transducer with metallopeptidase domain